ncbi:CotD family spore coat protein [Bacillus xiapuensis]|uniref:CotD family spore coat protein n=1 Tax=Bacillus xiapuensis TaxID=2014075 RepID=A0ABU6NC49_9BACI|nr:CotD family spore coat protein [Bacillus xiapuensis]
MYLGTNVTPPVIHPTTNIVNHTFSSTVVPHIHPVHTTTVNHHMYQHKHFCPQSASCCEDVCNQHINCCSPCAGPMGPGFGPVGPGFGAPGPGFGAPGPGFGMPGPTPFMGPRP